MQAFDESLAVNVGGTFLCMKYEIPAMLAAGGGSIVNMSRRRRLARQRGLTAPIRRRRVRKPAMLRKAAFGFAIAVSAVLALNAVAAAAPADPYASGTSGYDYSYPQCGVAAPSASFGIVGINAGYPFTYYNTCLAGEYGAAVNTHNAAVYINTGYDPTYTAIDGVHTTQACRDASASVPGSPDQLKAWAVGCSEAERDALYLLQQSPSAAPKAWWLDVEAANSWSSTDLTLNDYTVQGIVAKLRQITTAPVGVYSTAFQWGQIAGAYQPQVDANWLATGQRTLKRAKQSCGSTGFTGAKVWLVQYVATYDHDLVC